MPGDQQLQATDSQPNSSRAIVAIGLGLRMAIHRCLQNVPLRPEEVADLVAAYERTLKALWLVDRNDRITEIVAKKIIEVAQLGVRDPAAISRIGIEELKPS